VKRKKYFVNNHVIPAIVVIPQPGKATILQRNNHATLQRSNHTTLQRNNHATLQRNNQNSNVVVDLLDLE
jgi:hypothetical protein